MGYDMVRLIERLPDDNPDRLGLPDAVFIRPTVVAIFDNIEDRVTVVTPVWPSRRAVGRARPMRWPASGWPTPSPEFNRGINHEPLRMASPLPEPSRTSPRAVSRDGRAGEGVHPRRRHLPGGALAALRAAVPPAAVRALPGAAPAQPLAVPVLPRPRRLRAGRLEPRDPGPPARRQGHRPPDRRHAARGADKAEDEALAADLLADPKELAEHLMLLDLGRNDVGRVAQIGTVRVTEKMVVEYYSHVMHIVSNVEGTIDPNATRWTR